MVNEARDDFTRDSRVQCALDKRERTMHCHHEKIVDRRRFTWPSSAASTATALQG
ncbi:MAG: hypothetical protein WKF73_03020 [Nocardioidaceae bacterium]